MGREGEVLAGLIAENTEKMRWGKSVKEGTPDRDVMMSGESGLCGLHTWKWSLRLLPPTSFDKAVTTQQNVQRLPQVESDITGYSFNPASTQSFSLSSQV